MEKFEKLIVNFLKGVLGVLAGAMGGLLTAAMIDMTALQLEGCIWGNPEVVVYVSIMAMSAVIGVNTVRKLNKTISLYDRKEV